MRSALFTTKQRQSMKMADIQSPWMKSGIQALEHKYPDKPVTPGKAAHMEFEYIVMERSASSAFLMLLQDVWKNHI